MSFSKWRSRIPSVLVILVASMVLGQSTAWAQACATKNNDGTGSCFVVNAACASASPLGPGVCKNGTWPDSKWSCRCVDKAGGVILAGDPVPGPTTPSKGSGPGLDALAIVLGLLGLSWLYSRRLRRQ